MVLPRAHEHRLRVASDLAAAPAARQMSGSVDTLASEVAPEIDLFCGHYTARDGAGKLLFDGLPEVLHSSYGPRSDSPLQLLGELMRREATVGGPGSGAALVALCETLLALALRGGDSVEERARSFPPPWTAVRDPNIQTLIEAVVQQPDGPWTTVSLAQVAGMSRATLVRRFRVATGMTVADFVTRARMTVAAELLTSTRRSIEDIAVSVGYRSPSAFGRAFYNIAGATPSRLRRSAAEVTPLTGARRF
jgi:AraC family transcriptional regulator, activator of mtrCDE